MNQLTYPIQTFLPSDIVVAQFQNVNISTSYFLNMFKTCNPYSIEQCFINNSFVDDIIELIALIKLSPDTLQSSFVSSIPTSLQTSLLLYRNSNIDDDTNISIDVNSYDSSIVTFEKLVRLFQQFNYLDVVPNNRMNITNAQFLINILNGIIQQANVPAQVALQTPIYIEHIQKVTTYIIQIKNNTNISQNYITTVNTIFNSMFNEIDVNILIKLHILLKYINYIDSNKKRESILNIIDALAKRFQDLVSVDSLFDQIYTTVFQPAPVDNRVANRANPLMWTAYEWHLEILDKVYNLGIALTAAQQSEKAISQLLLYPCNDFQIINLSFITENVDTLLLNIYNIYTFLVNAYKSTPLFNICVDILNNNIEPQNSIQDFLYNFYFYLNIALDIPQGTLIHPDTILRNNIQLYVKYRFDNYIQYEQNKMFGIVRNMNSYITMSRDINMCNLLTSLSTYLVSSDFAIEIGNRLRTKISELDTNERASLIKTINRDANISNLVYVADLLVYLQRPTIDHLNLCFQSLEIADIRNIKFNELCTYIYANDAVVQQPLIRLEESFQLPPAPAQQVPPPIAPNTKLPMPIFNATPLHLGIQTSHSTHQKLNSFKGIISSSSSSSINITVNYDSTIYEDMLDLAYTNYNINDSYIPQPYSDRIEEKYKKLSTYHYNVISSIENQQAFTIENTYIFKYMTAYSRLYLINTYLNKYYLSYIYNVNKFETQKNKYTIDSRLSTLLNIVSTMKKSDILIDLCNEADTYLVLDKDEKIKIINNLISKKNLN